MPPGGGPPVAFGGGKLGKGMPRPMPAGGKPVGGGPFMGKGGIMPPGKPKGGGGKDGAPPRPCCIIGLGPAPSAA